MNQIFVLFAAIFSLIYGALTAAAGFSYTKENKIQIWAAWGFVLFGALIITAGLMALFGFTFALWVLVAGFLGVHILAINNGLKMFGKINPSHHLGRLLISVVLITLTYLGLK